MLQAILAILIGFIILAWSADRFVDGAAALARHLGISPLIVGLTIVGFGTSAPELVISAIAALAGNTNLAIGNAIGSNIANIGLVLGTTVLIAPLMVHQSCMKKELPLLLLATAGGAILILDGELSALDGGLMLGGLTILLWRMITTQIADPALSEEAEGEALPHLKPLRAWVSFILGLALFQTAKAYDFLQSVVYALGAGAGFTLALMLMAGLREKLELADVPAVSQGAAMSLMLAGLLSLAFMGFAGLGA